MEKKELILKFSLSWWTRSIVPSHNSLLVIPRNTLWYNVSVSFQTSLNIFSRLQSRELYSPQFLYILRYDPTRYNYTWSLHSIFVVIGIRKLTLAPYDLCKFNLQAPLIARSCKRKKLYISYRLFFKVTSHSHKNTYIIIIIYM